MTSVSAIDNVERSLGDSMTTPAQNGRRRWNAGSFVSAFFGFVCGLGGLTIGFLTVSELTVPSTGLYTSGTVLIGTSLILFGLAAHCLDKADAADKAMRLERCRQQGLKID